MSWHKSPLTSRTSAARSPRGILGLPAQELARDRVQTGRRLTGVNRPENRHAGRESALGNGQPFGGRALDGSDGVMYLPDDDRRAVRRRRKRPRGKAGPEPETDAHPGEPDPRRADEELADEEHGHARREVVPGDDGGVKVPACGSGRARPRGPALGNTPGHVQAHAALMSPMTRKARGSASRIGPLGVADRPARARAGGAFPQGYIQTGATPPGWGVGVPHQVPHLVPHQPHRLTAPAVKNGGSLPSSHSPLARLVSSGLGRKTRTGTANNGRVVCHTPPSLIATPPPVSAWHFDCPAPCPAPCHGTGPKRGAPSDRHLGASQPRG